MGGAGGTCLQQGAREAPPRDPGELGLAACSCPGWTGSWPRHARGRGCSGQSPRIEGVSQMPRMGLGGAGGSLGLASHPCPTQRPWSPRGQTGSKTWTHVSCSWVAPGPRENRPGYAPGAGAPDRSSCPLPTAGRSASHPREAFLPPHLRTQEAASSQRAGRGCSRVPELT